MTRHQQKKVREVSIFSYMIIFSIIFVFIITLVLSIGNFIRYKDLLYEYSLLKNYVNKELANYKSKLDDVQAKLGPNSLVDKYILSTNYINNFGIDLEYILSNLEDDPGTGYFMVFVIGSKSSWFTVKKGETTYFSRELKPGLSKYKFYYFKEPRIKTDYDIVISDDSDIVVGKPGQVYLLFFGVGSSFHPTKIVQVRDMKVTNIRKSFSLYVPGK
ncbi:hypothetical protein [Thermosipho atlanticus]|uniref:Uncharacterized protein n=1 Tax=Thermosipho atlanticus DSM 15807 TaxID=1123380 RepID=A0A1M5U0A0_9BACT|nr:hypothetical protein [Thermosipho atlanticus]SHH56457.1 hypothetical protein SAMN02745199_1568 [Thermosipho atlanticus DSM 15807]